MKIGIPDALCNKKDKVLYETFFEGLKVEVIYSHPTTKQTLNDGIKRAIDEECLASKIFLGHVEELAKRSKEEKIDYIFIPRICTFGNRKTVCVKFYALYDICKNLFDQKMITLNIDVDKKKGELQAFIMLGKELGKSSSESILSYIKAKQKQKNVMLQRLKEQNNQILKENMNILVVAHPYIYEDHYIGAPICNYLEKEGVHLVFADRNSSPFNKKDLKAYETISKSIYWKYNIDLLNGIVEYLEKVDGILYLSVFPCGTDCLVNELAMRKIKEVPSINLILDEQDGMAGVYTRLESFMDILKMKKKKEKSGVYEKV